MSRFVLIALSFLLFTAAEAMPSSNNEGGAAANGSIVSRIDMQHQNNAEAQRHRHRHHHRRRRK